MNKIKYDHRPAWAEPGDEKPSLGRRAFLTTGVAVGFAAAVQPVTAQIIHTDSEGLVAGQVMVPVPGGQIPAYRAYPAKGNVPFPTVLIVHEVFGVHEHIQDMARRIAKLGYYAIVPDLYSRQGDVAKMEKMDEVMAIVRATPDAQIVGDLDATVDFLGKTGQADVKRMGITGFCWGGRIVWVYAAHNPNLKAGAAWYGPLTSTNPEKPSAISLAPTIKVPVLGLYGGKDAHITADDIIAMKEALKGSKSEIVVYPDADHGFNADYRPTYNKQAAEDGWKRVREWFKANGVV